MNGPSADWINRRHLLVPPGLVLSFQRFQWPDEDLVEQAPQSLGALPVGLGRAGELLLPLADEEGFWIGLGLAPPADEFGLAIAVELAGEGLVDAISGRPWDAARPSVLSVPDTLRIEGIARPSRRLQLLVRHARGAPACDCLGLLFQITAARLRTGDAGEVRAFGLRLVDYRTFSRETGCPPPDPLDPDAGYKGWRLP